jgi:hypothetical protein
MNNNVINLFDNGDKVLDSISHARIPIQAMDMDHGHPVKTTEKYKHVNTRSIVDKFASRGWDIAKYSEGHTTKYAGYQTHVVQLRQVAAPIMVGDSELRIVIMNDHRGSKSLILKLGVFRLVCSNGLVLSDAEFESVRIKHIGKNIDEKVDEFIERIAASADMLRIKLAEYGAKELTLESQRKLARDMLVVRFPDKPIDEDMITNSLIARRWDDMRNDLWTTYNRIQESIVKGATGIRAIRSVKRDIELNTKLWDVLARVA